ncbi:MAG TPA: hypothetical protein VFM32_11135, partial [Spongiibacteraceae bacterium]|nr:hypothetical protein [Spongiibacteraceae bacterium]
SASIRWFGAELSNFLASTRPFLNLPIFSEIAQFEWALRHTVDAAHAERIDAASLQALDAEQWTALRCAWHPSLTLLHFNWNATQVWQTLIDGEEPPSPTSFASYWLVYRRNDLVSEWRSADAYEAECIQLWQRGENFGDICECLAQKIGDADSAVATAASFMRTWVEQGLLINPGTEESKNVCGD